MELPILKAAAVKILILGLHIFYLGGVHCAQPRGHSLLKKSPWTYSDGNHGYQHLLDEKLSHTVENGDKPFPNNSSVEVEALSTFKQTLDAPSRIALSSWNASAESPCEWEGITCSRQTGRVISIKLPGLGLGGNVSPMLGRLQDLQIIDLSHNLLSGEIPASLFNCTQLVHLVLANNTFTGQIPPQVGHLLRLLTLDVSSNFYLQSIIPPSIGNCSLLKSLRLDYTIIQGEIPHEVGKLSHLEAFNLTNTLNNGSVPASLGNCSSLVFLGLGNIHLTNLTTGPVPGIAFPPGESQLSGTLPDELGNLRQLQVIFIVGTNIDGPFPSWIANLTSIAWIGIGSCRLSGPVPDFLGSLPLEYVGLTENFFSGEIPITMANCSSLTHLELDGLHYLHGVIPSNLGQLTNLASLYLTDNNLEGKVPSTLSNCSALEELALGLNSNMDVQPLEPWIGSLINLRKIYLPAINLGGRIPAAIGELSQLETLVLEDNYLTGSVDKSLGNCSKLQWLHLGYNSLSGTLPAEFWELRQIFQLSISGNSITGSLSDAIANMSYLNYLDCSGNLLNSTIPSRITELSQLNHVDFDLNRFDGPLPAAIGNLSALQYFDISLNSVSGSIPTSIGNLSSLVIFVLSSNQLSGSIPVDLMGCSDLDTLYLDANLLRDNIPLEIGQLRLLGDLNLQHNQLSGGFPQALQFCPNLRWVDLSYNAFQGVLPRNILVNASKTLTTLNLSHNSFSGTLPEAFGELNSMTELQLSANNFSGSIPSALGNCRSLQVVDLSENKINGTVPKFLGSLKDLALLNLSYNELEGPLPDAGIFVSNKFSAEWFLGNPELCGSRLGKNCSVLRSTSSSCSGLSCSSTRLAVIIPCSAIFGVLFVGIAICMTSRLWRAQRCARTSDLDNGFLMFTSDVQLTEQDLIQIAQNSGNFIGRGASSCVYRANLERGPVAIKVWTMSGHAGGESHEKLQTAIGQMRKEAHLLAGVRHRNVLKLLGMFSTDKMTGLVLEFMPMGSLHNLLHDVRPCTLSWERRLDVALGVAQGLVHLHEGVQAPIIHRDLKPQNILLDADMTPKVADFGLSKLSKRGLTDELVTASHWCGTVGYIPPEYVRDTRVSTRGDVYSFGMVLLELLSGRRPMEEVSDQSSGASNNVCNPLVRRVYKSFSEKAVCPLDVVDPSLRDSHGNLAEKEAEQMKLWIQVGLLCTQENPQSRPRMRDVMAMLTHIKELGDAQGPIPTTDQLAEKEENVELSQSNDSVAHNVAGSSLLRWSRDAELYTISDV